MAEPDSGADEVSLWTPTTGAMTKIKRHPAVHGYAAGIAIVGFLQRESVVQEKAISTLGPSCLATLVCRELDSAVEAYCGYLHLQQLQRGPVSEALACLWQAPGLAGCHSALLANALGEPWLRLVEDKSVESLTPLAYHGWLALEVLVEDVDELVAGLAGSPFEVLRPVADLELSDCIRACQVSGPCGEVLYLTQIKGDVPPFDLPRARCAVDRLFIPVMSAPDRAAACAFYEQFPGTGGLNFDTKITVVNQAHDIGLERQHPVATMLLRDQCLIEVDQLAMLKPRPQAPGRLPSNIASVSFEVDSLDLGLDWLSPPRVLEGPVYGGRRVGLAIGNGGEWVELIER